jgi:hypothetical protein
VKTGVQGFLNLLKLLDSGFRRNDVPWVSATFYELVNNDIKEILPSGLQALRPLWLSDLVAEKLRGNEHANI